MAVERIKISVRFDQLHKTNCENELNAALKREFMFGWLPEEYLKRKIELETVSAEWPSCKFVKNVDDKRTLKPIPPTTNGIIGWVCSKKEFQLERYGPDVTKYAPLPMEEF